MKLKRAHFATAMHQASSQRALVESITKRLFWLLKIKNCFVYLRQYCMHRRLAALSSSGHQILGDIFAYSCFLTKKTCLFILGRLLQGCFPNSLCCLTSCLIFNSREPLRISEKYKNDRYLC